MKRLLAAMAFFLPSHVLATPQSDYLIQLSNSNDTTRFRIQNILPQDSQVEDLKLNNWVRVQIPEERLHLFRVQALTTHPSVVHIQPNYKLSLMHDFRAKDPAARRRLLEELANSTSEDGGFPWPGNEVGTSGPDKDNPAIPEAGNGESGADPLLSSQWGMKQIGVERAWQETKGSEDVVVAVIDTGVDYTHEDLIDNIWRNPGETGSDDQGRDKSSNGVDDDNNGYIDDVIGWDFVTNDNKPYDLSVSLWEMLLGGGNPGHGTHCAGNVAARGDNGKGIAGVAPNVKIMPLRFLSEKGQGTTADAVKAVRYAIDNGAKVLSNSWGSEGEDSDEAGNKALKDAIRYSEEKGALFVAAAGNGHQGIGYNNDTDARPAYPASYDMDIIISVAAIDEAGQLGSFSNWGPKTVDIGAPGVKVFSTTIGNGYNDTVANFLGQKITWDGTSMATPHVAGAAALYWSKHPNKSWQEVKSAILNSVQKTSVLANKVTSGGQLDAESMMRH